VIPYGPLSPESQQRHDNFFSAENSFEDDSIMPANPTLDRYASLRLPELWTDGAQAWFIHLAAECDLRNPPSTKASTKYHLVSTALPAAVRSQVSVILDKPPEDGFNALKEALLALFTKTPLEEAFDLLDLGDIGDQLASTHNQHMRKLWNNDGEAVYKALFLRSLPQFLQDSLADSEEGADELAKKADKIIKNRRANKAAAPSINVMSEYKPCAAEQREHNAIRSKYNDASSKFNKDKNSVKDNAGLCYAHRKFGKEAYSCKGAPCPMVGITAPKPVGKDDTGRSRILRSARKILSNLLPHLCSHAQILILTIKHLHNTLEYKTLFRRKAYRLGSLVETPLGRPGTFRFQGWPVGNTSETQSSTE
jgi:RNase P protein component